MKKKRKESGKEKHTMVLDIMKRIKRCQQEDRGAGQEKNRIVAAMMLEYEFSYSIVMACYKEVNQQLLELESGLTEDAEYNRHLLSGPVHKRAKKFHAKAMKEIEAAEDLPPSVPEGDSSDTSAKAWKRASGYSMDALKLEQTLAKWHHLETIAPALELESEPTREYLTDAMVRHFHAFDTTAILRIMEAAQRELETRPDTVERTRAHMRDSRSFTRFLYNIHQSAQDLESPRSWETPDDDITDKTSH